MAVSQLIGGWTKWGRPRISSSVLLIAFVPVAVVTLWVILAGEPSHDWFQRHVAAWTGDIHVSAVVTDLLPYIPVLAFGTGLVFGFSFETSGPRPVAVERVGEPETRSEPKTPAAEAVEANPERQRETTRAS